MPELTPEEYTTRQLMKAEAELREAKDKVRELTGVKSEAITSLQTVNRLLEVLKQNEAFSSREAGAIDLIMSFVTDRLNWIDASDIPF